MTPIPGTVDTDLLAKKKADNPAKNISELLGVYTKKEPEIKKKITLEGKKWDASLVYWLKISGIISVVSIALGFLVYKSFFILAVFVPFAVVAIWYLVKFIEDEISKFDPFST
jgi:hypothetical protein